MNKEEQYKIDKEVFGELRDDLIKIYKQNPDDETITDWQLELIDTFEQGVERGKAQQKKEIIEMINKLQDDIELAYSDDPDETELNDIEEYRILEVLKKQLETK